MTVAGVLIWLTPCPPTIAIYWPNPFGLDMRHSVGPRPGAPADPRRRVRSRLPSRPQPAGAWLAGLSGVPQKADLRRLSRALRADNRVPHLPGQGPRVSPARPSLAHIAGVVVATLRSSPGKNLQSPMTSARGHGVLRFGLRPGSHGARTHRRQFLTLLILRWPCRQAARHSPNRHPEQCYCPAERPLAQAFSERRSGAWQPFLAAGLLRHLRSRHDV